MPTLTVLAVVNLKGGAGKTTATAWCAHALHELGLRVLVVDADPQRSAFTWYETADWPMRCLPIPSAKLPREIPGHAAGRYDVVVVDTPGTDEGRAIARSAVKAATHVLVPSAPTPVEYERLRGLRVLLDDVVDAGGEFELGVLFNRAVSGAVSTQTYRDAMTADGWRVLRPVVPRLERFAQSFGEPVADARETGYGWAVAELLALPVVPAPRNPERAPA